MCYINSKCGNPLCLPWSFIEDPFFYRFIQSCKSPAAAASSSSLSVPFSDPIASFFSSLDFPSLEAILNPFSDSSPSPAFSPSVHFFPFPHYSGFQDRAASFFDPSDVHHSMYQWDDFAFTLQNQSYTSLLYKLLVRFVDDL